MYDLSGAFFITREMWLIRLKQQLKLLDNMLSDRQIRASFPLLISGVNKDT